MTPRFSIVLPTYNRRDTILRAVRSVQAQTFRDWELLIVDDGSTDGTRDLLPSDDPRIVVIVQPNGGVASARNAALRARRGDLVAFLDSDDEWLPHHLALADAFFRAHPDEQVVIGEFLQNWSNGLVLRHFEVELTEWFPALAKRAGSTFFTAPSTDDDPYLRVYSDRRPIGEWGRQIAQSAGFPQAAHYRGHIFEAWRWGWLMLLQSTVLRSDVVDAIGLFDEEYHVASDYPWMAELSRYCSVNLLSLPVVIKHEFGAEGEGLSEGHLAWGEAGVRFYRDVLSAFDTLFWNRLERTAELHSIREHWRLQLVAAALLRGDRQQALEALWTEAEGPGRMKMRLLRLFLTVVRYGAAVRILYRGWTRLLGAPARIRTRLRRHALAALP